MSDQNYLPAWREQSLGRRGFLRVSAASAATVTLLAAGCGTDTPQPLPTTDPFSLVLPTQDAGLQYYLYFVAFAKATLYQKVVDAFPADFSAADRGVFEDLRDHEVINRELLRRILDPTGQVVLVPAAVVFSLASFNLANRAGVLSAAQQLEDLAAAAYPAVLPLFINTSTRALLLKISSVQSRQAAAVRDMRVPGSFAADDVVTTTGVLAGQLRTKTPTEVMAALAPNFAPYVISTANLPIPV